MKRTLSLFVLLINMLIIACNNQTNEQPLLSESASALPQKDSLVSDTAGQAADDDSLTPKTVTYEGYEIKYGYLKYNADDNEHPGLLQVFKNGKLIFTDSLQVEGGMFFNSLGYHDVSGRKLFFTLTCGRDACDYMDHTRYYFIAPDNNAYYLNEYVSLCGGDGYSCLGFNHVFPDDSSGIKDALRIIERLHYNENDHPDLFDTTNIYFTENKFNISKLTHNLEKAN